MIVLQIDIGDHSDLERDCMASVQAWAEKRGYQYHVIHDLPATLGHWDIRAACNYLRIEYAAREAPVLYVDRDIKLFSGFDIDPDAPFIACQKNPDALFYVRDSAIAQDILDRLENYLDTHSAGNQEPGRLWKIMRREPTITYSTIDRVHYYHYRQSAQRGAREGSNYGYDFC